MKQEELNEILRLHKLWLEGVAGGARADLKGADLERADLKGAILAAADLAGANLAVADLREANLKGVNLSEANLEGARLCGAELAGAHLNEARLRGTDLADANLECAHLRGANLEGANLECAELGGANLKGARLSWANLKGADLDYACWPLWCGSLDVTVDSKIASQLVYHTVRACQSVKDDADIVEMCKNPALIKIANRFHLADECGKIESKDGCEMSTKSYAKETRDRLVEAGNFVDADTEVDDLMQIIDDEREINRLEAENARLEAENARLEAENARLEAENARLEEENAKRREELLIIAGGSHMPQLAAEALAAEGGAK